MANELVQRWYARPVFFVADLQRAIDFYVDKLGFVKQWHSNDGKGTVCQVNRSDCELILCEDSSRTDKARLFVELTQEGIDELEREIAARSITTEKGWWGYNVIIVKDLDGNELFFPLLDQ